VHVLEILFVASTRFRTCAATEPSAGAGKWCHVRKNLRKLSTAWTCRGPRATRVDRSCQIDATASYALIGLVVMSCSSKLDPGELGRLISYTSARGQGFTAYAILHCGWCEVIEVAPQPTEDVQNLGFGSDARRSTPGSGSCSDARFERLVLFSKTRCVSFMRCRDRGRKQNNVETSYETWDLAFVIPLFTPHFPVQAAAC